MTSGQIGRPDASMTLLTEMMQRPLDPGYAAAAANRQESGLPAATGRRSPLLIIASILIGALLGASALALRTPTTAAGRIKLGLVDRIEAGRAHADVQTRRIATLRAEISSEQAAALSQQSQGGLTAELSQLELAAGTVPVTGPGLVLTVDDAESKAEPEAPDADPPAAIGPDEGKVIAKDLQLIVNGLWAAGAEAISINGQRLTSRAAIRSAGEAILVDYRPLARPYAITAIGDPGSLGVEFADNSGGSYLQSLKNYKVRTNIENRPSVTIPGEPALSLDKARPVESATTNQPGTRQPTSSAGAPKTASQTTAPPTTETSP